MKTNYLFPAMQCDPDQYFTDALRDHLQARVLATTSHGPCTAYRYNQPGAGAHSTSNLLMVIKSVLNCEINPLGNAASYSCI